MSLNPRVNSPAAFESLGWGQSFASSSVIARGRVVFDLNDPTDVNIINDGKVKYVTWWVDSPSYDADQVIHPLAMSSFAVYSLGETGATGADDYIWDFASEVRLVGGQKMGDVDSEMPIAVAWQWPAAAWAEVFPNVVDDGEGPLICYQGAPIFPSIGVRSGMVIGESTATAVVTYNFELRMMPGVAASGQVVSVPSPYCVPPFIPKNAESGQYIFCDHATLPYPSSQNLAFPRTFTSPPITVGIGGGFDARIFGGPWTGSMDGATSLGGGTSDWDIESIAHPIAGMLPGVAPVITIGSAPACSLHTPAGQNYGGLRFTQLDAVDSVTMILSTNYRG